MIMKDVFAFTIYSNFIAVPLLTRGTPKGRKGAAELWHPPNPKFKKHNFVDIMISNALRDFPFCQNQPLKSADY
jgi:hypothetical protein